MNAAWSRIQNTELAEVAVGRITQNMYDDLTDMDMSVVLHYHNLEHVRSMYQHLEDTAEPYDEVLDWAVLFHDVIYDEKPDKELRSGLYFIQQAEAVGCSLSQDERFQVVQLIMHTEKHEDLNCPLVRADLHQLADPVQAFRNFRLIMEESMELYDIDEITFASNSEKFMCGLLCRVSKPMDKSNMHYELWQRICRGIDATITFAELITRKP